MDYDDNDFQSQNLQLAGEGSNKFSPAIRPYALSKFEFDDSLHGHLRFDSLTETEVFLGIESNEDNQWIEDFSQPSSEIVFPTSAAETCSIPRRNNVWSEATSSESVEMLLKSVGQEDIVPGQTVTRESDACDELGCMIKQMDSSLKPEKNSTSKVEDVIGPNPTSQLVDVAQASSELKGDARAEHPEAGDAVDGCFSDPSTGSENAKTDVTEPMSSTANDVLYNQDDTCLENVIDEVIDTSGNKFAIGEKCQEGRGVNNDDHNSDEHVVSVVSSHVDNISPSEMEFKKDGNIVKTSVTLEVKVDADFHAVEGQSEAVFSGTLAPGTKSDGLVMSKESIVSDQSTENVHDALPMASEGDTGLKGRDGEVSNINTEIITSLQSKEDSVVQITCSQSTTQKEQFVENSSKLDPKSLTCEFAEPVLAVQDGKVSKSEGDRSSKSCSGDISSLNVVCSSVEFTMTQTSTTYDRVDNASGDCGGESTKKCEENMDSNNDDAYKCVQKATTEMLIDSGNTKCGDGGSMVVDKEVGSSSIVEGNMENTLVSKLQSKAVVGDDSAGIPLHSAEGVLIDAVDKQEPLLPIVQTPAEVEEGSLNPASTLNGSLSNINTSPERRTKSHVLSESGEGAPCAAGDEFSLKADNKPLPLANTSNSESQSDQPVSPIPAVMQEYGKEMGISTLSDSPLRESGTDEAKVISEKHEEANNKESHERASSEVTESELVKRNGDMLSNPVPSSLKQSSSDTGLDGGKYNETASVSGDKTSGQNSIPRTEMESGCSSPIIIRTSEPCQSGAEKKRVKGSTDQTGLASKDPKENVNDVSTGDRSFTFEVPPLAELSKKDTGKNWNPFPSMQQGKASSTAEASPTSSLSQVGIKTAQDPSQGNLKASDKANVRGGPKGSSERKPRKTPAKSTGKEAPKRGSTGKKATPPRKSGRGDKTSQEISPYGHAENSSVKPFGVISSVSTLPDLNTAASSSAIFHQPFTDLQQVQLRAQIFVYGALIQGMAPDEAYMISSFGGPDGGRSLWEKNWRACIERMHGQKSHTINPETPQSHLGAKTDQAKKPTAPQNKVTPSPASRGANKGTPTTVVNPIIPLSSPLWSVSTPSGDALKSTGIPRGVVMDYQQAISPFHTHQTPPIRNFVNPPWVSQSPFRAPWAPHASTVDTSARPPPLPVTEPVNSTPGRESSKPHSSGVKQVPPVPVVQSGSPAIVFPGTPVLDPKKAVVTPGQHTAEPKSRKRKKTTPVAEEPGQFTLHSKPQTVTHSAPVLTSGICTTVAIATPSTIVSNPSFEKSIVPASPALTPAQLQMVDRDAGQKSSLSEETHNKLKESQIQAASAASLAAAAIGHSQQLWNELNRHKNLELAVDIETKLTSAAVAIAAAAAVAKAAAAAANVASNAALQAKLMADEALVSISSDGMNNLGKATPVSILKGEDATNSSNSIITAAREAARRRVEVASAASKHAENMDAIVKAAELASEAVSQAGTIVAMGESFSLGELVEAGPEAYWRARKVSSEQVTKSNDVNREKSSGNGHESQGWSAPHPNEPLLEKETQIANHGSSATSGKDRKRQKGRKAPDFARTMVAVPESENGLSSPVTNQSENEKNEETLKDPNFRQGSLVEVLRVGGGTKAAWFLANVVRLKDGKAFVCYDELQSEDDGDKLKEWVELKGDGEEAPRIRVACPVMPSEGTRKRRRAAIGDYNWNIGDRVDAWMQDSWWEGIVTEKNKKDETSFTVQFPGAQGQTSTVKAWHLRPSRIWTDGNWVVWSGSGDNNVSTHEGDTPQEKRPRLRSPPAEGKGKEKVSKGTETTVSAKPDDTRLLDLAPSEKIFNIGKTSRDANKTDSLRMKRTGLQKEGPRVVFGIPKPGKKRKFMDVSKHYVSDKSNKNLEANDSVKFTKYLMPQGAGPRAARSNPRSEPKEKPMAVSKPRVPKSGKPQNVYSRTVARKENFSNVSVSETDDDDDDASDVSKSKDSQSHDETTSFGSEGAAEGPILFSSTGRSSDTPASKKTSSSNSKWDRLSKGIPLASGKLAKIDENKESSLEPRRSNRRIQPTSRLLEGLQSSLIISKIPSVSSHDKGPRSHSSRSARRE